jgi:hypothetical protein
MASYIGQPEFPVDFLRPTGALFDVQGSSVDGGVNGVGEAIEIGTSGGGRVIASYREMVLEGPDERHEIINQLGARLNGGFRFIVVPFITDDVGPFPIIEGRRRPIISGITHSDGSTFSDGSGYSQATVYGELNASAALNAGVISLTMTGMDRRLRHSDWFSIYHPTKGWRAYRYWDVLDGPSGINGNYQLAISPPLREAMPPGTRVEFARPRCVMKLARGETIPWEWEAWYSARPSINFVEAF